MKAIRKILFIPSVIAIALLQITHFDRAVSAGLFLNNGAKISIAGKTFIKLDSLNFKIDNTGVVNFANNSFIQTNCNITITNGSLTIRDTTTILTTKSIFNFSSFSNFWPALTIVKGNFKNAGSVYNESIIELGE